MDASERNRPELLAPAGDREALRAAVANGADTVCFGLPGFNARRRASSFAPAALPDVVGYLHDHNVNGYVTFNTLVFSDELPRAAEYATTIAEAGAHAHAARRGHRPPARTARSQALVPVRGLPIGRPRVRRLWLALPQPRAVSARPCRRSSSNLAGGTWSPHRLRRGGVLGGGVGGEGWGCGTTGSSCCARRRPRFRCRSILTSVYLGTLAVEFERGWRAERRVRGSRGRRQVDPRIGSDNSWCVVVGDAPFSGRRLLT